MHDMTKERPVERGWYLLVGRLMEGSPFYKVALFDGTHFADHGELPQAVSWFTHWEKLPPPDTW